MEEKEYDYLIPPNIRQKFVLFDSLGIGWIELGIIILGVGIGILLFMVAGLFTAHLARLFLIVVPAGIAFAVVLPFDLTGQRYLDRFMDFLKYRNVKRKYYYVAGKGVNQSVD